MRLENGGDSHQSALELGASPPPIDRARRVRQELAYEENPSRCDRLVQVVERGRDAVNELAVFADSCLVVEYPRSVESGRLR